MPQGFGVWWFALGATVLSSGLFAHAQEIAPIPDDPAPLDDGSPFVGGQSRTFMAPMRDGTRLATTVMLPQGEGPWPAMFVRTPYSRKALWGMQPRYLEAGIACVAQDIRGFFESEGKLLIPFMDDGWGPRQDGHDSVKWISEQPWCNGRVGTVGASALGITQYLMAVTQPPGLVCQHIELAPVSLYHGAAHPGGPARQSLLDAWLPARGFTDVIRRAITALDTYNVIWEQFDATTREKDADTPAMHWVGWYDQFRDSNIEGFQSRQHRAGPNSRGRQHMIIGPWDHRHPWQREIGEVVFPESAATHPYFDTTEDHLMRVRYFQAALVSDTPGADDKFPAVAYYLMGAVGEAGAPGNVWKTATDWPVPAQDRALHLTDDGALTEDAPAEARWRVIAHDPDNPTPTIGGSNEHIPAGPRDQRPIEGHPDAHVFTGGLLEKPLIVEGMARVTVKFKSDAPDCDLAVRLCDVYPDGRAMLVSDGIQRAKLRDGFATVKPLLPFQSYEMTVEVGNTAYAFNKGHRVRVILSSTNAPRFGPNGTRTWLLGKVVKNQVLLGGSEGARLWLPVVGP